MTKNKVVIGFLGTQLDSGKGAGRWEKWRPTVSLHQHEHMAVQRLELLYTARHQALAEQVRADIHTASADTAVHLWPLLIDDPWDFGEVYAALFDWAQAYPFDTERNDYWVHITTGTHVAQICLFLLVESRRFPGVLVQTAPPKRQQSDQPGSYTLIDLDVSHYDAIASRFHAEQRDAVQFLKSGIATGNPQFNALIEEVERVAVRSRAPILFTGPTGAGKSYLARRMYELKKARNQVSGAFVEVNCATLRGDGAASALFGHKKGAFTGAASERAGLLRSAHQGVLFLDEIGELGVDEQAMLLKAIEEKRFLPVGADREVESDFQLLAGTNRDLRLDVAAGRFRDDLFARINLWSYTLPGLAQRPEDIAPNLEHVLALYSTENNRVVRFNAEARALYLQFAQSHEASWRGNFRDLSGSITRLATLAEGGRIGVDLVQAELQRLRWLWQRDPVPRTDDSAVDLSQWLPAAQLDQLDLFDRLQLASVIQVCRASSNLSDAGRQLFQASRLQRQTANDADRLRKYLVRFGLEWKALKAP